MFCSIICCTVTLYLSMYVSSPVFLSFAFNDILSLFHLDFEYVNDVEYRNELIQVIISWRVLSYISTRDDKFFMTLWKKAIFPLWKKGRYFIFEKTIFYFLKHCFTFFNKLKENVNTFYLFSWPQGPFNHYNSEVLLDLLWIMNHISLNSF